MPISLYFRYLKHPAKINLLLYMIDSDYDYLDILTN